MGYAVLRAWICQFNSTLTVFITPEHAVTVEKHLQRLAKKKLLISVVYDECHLATDLGWFVIFHFFRLDYGVNQGFIS
jgi:hypothetical protein